MEINPFYPKFVERLLIAVLIQLLIIGLFMLFISPGFNVGRSCDPTIPFPDTYSKNSVSYYKDLHTFSFVFTKAVRKWN